MRAFAMFAVGSGANQFAPMLIVYRHELRLSAGGVAGADRALAGVAAVPCLRAGLGGLAGQAGAFGVLAVAGRRYAPAPGSSRERSRAG
jgi:hypothetical protein